MKPFNFGIPILLASAAALSLTLWGCFGVVSPVTAGQAPRYGGTLTVLVPLLPTQLEPLQWTGDMGSQVSRAVYEGLTQWGDRGPEASLALRWNASEDFKRWVFTLRRGVIFHDGSACDSRAVITSLHRLATPGDSPFAWILRDLVGWEAFVSGATAAIEGILPLSEQEVELHFNQSVPDLPARLSLPAAAIARWVDTGPLGTGPFRVASSNSREASLEAFDGYHGGRAFLDRIELSIERASTNASRTHLTKITPEAHVSRKDDQERDRNSNFEVASWRLGGALIRPRSPVFSSPELRAQLSLSFDRDVFVRTSLFGRGRSAYSVFPGSNLGRSVFDPTRTGDLLQQPGDQVRILVEQSEPVLKQLAERFQVHLFSFGLRAEIEVLPPDAFEVALLADRWDMLIFGWTSSPYEGTEIIEETRVQNVLASFLAPTLGRQMPNSWQLMKDGRDKALEQGLLAEFYLIPLVFFHDMYATGSRLVQIGSNSSLKRIDFANTYLRPRAQ